MKYVIFDFDGTLADSLSVAIAIARELEPSVNLDDAEIAELRNMPARQIVKRSGIPYWRIAKLLIKGKRILARRLDEVKIFPGIPEVLRSLNEQGYEIAVVSSNTEVTIRKVLEREGIDQYVTRVYGNVGLFNKARAFKIALRDQNLTPDQAIYVGDEVRDIEAARRGHIPIISVTWGFNGEKILASYKPTYLVDTPKQLLETITKHSTAA